MQKESGIIVILAIALLSICYFSPLNGVESFANITGLISAGYKNPQGSIGDVPGTFYPGSSVSQDKWKPGNLQNTYQQEPGPPTNLNMTDVQASFPYMEQSRQSNNETISLIKPDGVVVGGYLPQILRPFDSVSAQSSDDKCSWPCYSDRKYQKWCNEEDAINYYGMRPLVSPSNYNKNLQKMFNIMIDRNAPRSQTPEEDKYTAVFCTENKESIMSWLMQKVASAVAKMPEMQRNGPWKSERFTETDVQLYQFVSPEGAVHFKIVFNLFNPLRSVATLVEATVALADGKPILKQMGFVNDGEMGIYQPPENGWGPINGQNTSMNEKYGIGIEQFEPLGVPQTPEGLQMWESAYEQNPNEFDWNFQNTLEVQKFNKHGFYSNVPGDNVKIEGGVPDSLKTRMKACKEDNLMSCTTPGYTGITAVSARSLNNGGDLEASMDKLSKQRMGDVKTKVAPMNGSVKNVYENPRLVYSTPTLNIRDAKIEVIGKVNT